MRLGFFRSGNCHDRRRGGKTVPAMECRYGRLWSRADLFFQLPRWCQLGAEIGRFARSDGCGSRISCSRCWRGRRCPHCLDGSTKQSNWNVYYQRSGDGGTTWSTESTLSTYVSGYTYIFSDGFRFPFGDYFDLTIDYLDHTQACWGEGYNWLIPGSVWYTRQLR